MSKFRFASIWSTPPFATCSATYAVEPTSPASSAPQNAKRTRLRGLSSASRSARRSRGSEVPEPLSLMPGPSGTSRGARRRRSCAPCCPSASRRSRCTADSASSSASTTSGRHRAGLRLAVELLTDVVQLPSPRDRRVRSAVMGIGSSRSSPPSLKINAASRPRPWRSGTCPRTCRCRAASARSCRWRREVTRVAAAPRVPAPPGSGIRVAGTTPRRSVTGGRELGHDVVGVLDARLRAGANSASVDGPVLADREVELVERHAVPGRARRC